MKQPIKLLISFIAGAATVAAVLSFWLPTRLISGQSIVGEGVPQWSLESFQTINEEMRELVGDPNITMAVIPTRDGNGYEVLATDVRLRARFGIVSWNQALERINDRMESLRKSQYEAEQAASSNP